jgi:hypothetical protein
MRIRLAFTDDNLTPDQMPNLIAAVDEYTEDEWGRLPDFYQDDVAKCKNVREVYVHIDDNQVSALFRLIPTLAGSTSRVES